MGAIASRSATLALALLGLLLALAVPVGAQQIPLAGHVTTALPSEQMSADERDALYAQLNREVDALERYGNVLKMVVKLASPSVVHIEARKTEGARIYGGRRIVEEAGSGVIIRLDNSFYILTNRHVIKDAALESILIKGAEGHELQPTQVWADKDTDVAVLAVGAKDLLPARIGNSDEVEIGDFVLAVGSPFGLSHSVTYGIISAKGRRDLDLGDGGVTFQDFMQTDAAINPGNSGGPLLNLRGQLVGINTAIASNSGGNEGIGFSIPINMAMSRARQLIETGTVTRAFLGVTLDSTFSNARAIELGLPRRQGARVTRVTAGSPAEKANLQTDDVIVQFNGVRIDNDKHLINVIGLTAVGSEVPMLVVRQREPLQVTVRVADFQEFMQQQSLSRGARP